MDTKKMYLGLRSLLLQKIEEELKKPGMNAYKLNAQLNLSPNTIYKFSTGERGKNISLESYVEVAVKMGIPTEEILSVMDPELAKTVSKIIDMDGEVLEKIKQILESDEQSKKKFLNDIDYLYQQTVRQ